MQAFLGLINWGMRFIPHVSEKSRPLEGLLKKKAKFLWTHEHTTAMEEIKNAFREAEALFLFQISKPIGIECDASQIGLGSRLFQRKNSNSEELETIAYASRALKESEKRYTVTELECLSVVWALKKWQICLIGRKITIRTDHRALIAS